MKLSDYVFQFLADHGVHHVFLLTGGAAMHLNDSLGRENRIQYICNHHEQASAMAAECYARVSGEVGVVSVTAGPGGINALNGVFGAWTDSVPMLVVSGHAKRETSAPVLGIEKIRQLGDQEVDIVRMVKHITKYAVLVSDPSTIRYHLEKAYHLAAAGRPGPCWLDLPVDVQSAKIDPATQIGYDSTEDDIDFDTELLRRQCAEVITKLRAAERPVIMAGTGVRAAHALEIFEKIIRKLGIPVTTAWTHDLIASDDPLFCGRPGTIGERAGNFTVQNADVLLVLGSRLNVRQVSYNWSSFAREAFKIQVDIDPAELVKPLVRPDLPIQSDLKVFLTELGSQLDGWEPQPAHQNWLAWCRERVARYPVVQSKHRRSSSPINPYYFIELLFAGLKPDDVVVCGDATACIVPYQAARLKKGQRLISNSGSASMGYDLPAAIGAAVARGSGRVICLAGDGSVQLNIQELQTLAHHRLPVKLLVLNNGGYLSIRQTQSNFFGQAVGAGPESGVSFPDFTKVAEAYAVNSACVTGVDCMPRLWQLLDAPGPALCEVMLDTKQEFEPRLKSRQLPDGTIVSPALEDMFPFLEPEELRSNLFIKPAQ
ncbi:MAG: thiamine pyrophosphate-binding protein [Acidobacteriaceae bacterium]|nr:thiamine pyrophosphate-binding protein [Acidobacteriaceae bacterium]